MKRLVSLAPARAWWIIPILVIVLLEVSIGNLGFWKGVIQQPTALSSRVSVSSGASGEASGSPRDFVVTDPDNLVLIVSSPVIESDEGLVLRTLHVDLDTEHAGARFGIGSVMLIRPLVRAEGNMADLQPLGVAPYIEGIPSTHWLQLYPQGAAHELELKVSGLSQGTHFSVNDVRLNAPVPFSLHPLRTWAFLVLFGFLASFAPSRRMYSMPVNFDEWASRWRVCLFVVLGVFLLVAMTQVIQPDRFFHSVGYSDGGAFIRDEDQANHYANAILAGHLWLDLPVPQWLAEMSNPYDATSRMAQSLATGQPTYWDFAFYNGRYYSYFGVLPILVFFVPFKVLTGRDLPTDHAVALLCALFVMSVFYCTYHAIRRYWPHARLGHYILMSIFMVLASGSINQAFLPKVYSLPMLTSLVVTLFGMGLWFAASRNPDGRWARVELAVGALLIALNLFGRPLFVLAGFFGLAIFCGELRHRFFSAWGWRNAVAVVVPFLAVGAATIWFNTVRFGSPFDFGAKYNLTGFDMTHKPMVVERLGETLWMYLFQPLNMSPNFPFLKEVDVPATTLGLTIQEPYYGGLFAFAPLLWCLFLVPFLWRRMKGNRPLFAALVSFTLCLAVVEGLMVSYTPRYQSDFAWALVLATILVLGEIWKAIHRIVVAQSFGASSDPLTEEGGGTGSTSSLLNGGRPQLDETVILLWMTRVVYGLVVLGMLWNLLNVFSTGRYEALVDSNPTAYYIVGSWI